MSTTLDLFASIEARDAGMMQAYESRADLVSDIRKRLELIAAGRADRTASADDVSNLLEQMGLDNSDLGNAAGSVFTYGRWEIARFEQSKRKSNHARRITIWRLK